MVITKGEHCLIMSPTTGAEVEAHPVVQFSSPTLTWKEVFMRTLCLILGFLLVTSPLIAQPQVINLRLPSEAAGGELAIRLTIPPPQVGPRYATGAPVLVFVPGGHGVGGLDGGEIYAIEGFVAVTFIFPGGSAGGFHSDGTYDYRGEDCIDALRDVLLFAGGRKTDHQGRAIEHHLPFPPLTEMVGVIGFSNGGPTSMATLARHGSDLDFVATYVGFENPTNSQTVVLEVGAKPYDCDQTHDGDGNGIPNDDGKNPYLAGYGPTSIDMDFDLLAFDPTVNWGAFDPAEEHPPVEIMGVIFLDGNGNGSVDAVIGDDDCYDVDGNGQLDVGEDYAFRPAVSYETGGLKLHYSIEAINRADAQGLFGREWPPEIATPLENQAHWSHRDATFFYGDLAAVRPDLHCLLAFGEADHMQAADEHPHIQQAYEGMRVNGLWCRLNPDEAYYLLVDPTPPGTPCDHDANLPVSWPDMAGYGEPYPLGGSEAALAGVLEMADRAYWDNWSPNLPAPVSSVNLPDGRPDVRSWVRPHPAGIGSRLIWEGLSRADLHVQLYDMTGRRHAVCRILTPASTGSLPLASLFRNGKQPAAGVYWLELRSAGYHQVHRFVLLSR
jgi:hypothetical protein